MSSPSPQEPKIYLLPNLMTAGNLFCGFMAVLHIMNGMGVTTPTSDTHPYHHAIAFILGACLFDLLDGRFARAKGQASDFGREFDSIADVISFGFAPALLVHAIVLKGMDDRIGWFISFIYLLCGAMRLARFNCIAANVGLSTASKDFLGFPIPAAAGVIASLTLLLIWLEGSERDLGPLRYGLPFLMLGLSFLMFSRVKYPSFKKINWKSRHSIPVILGVVLVIVSTILFWEWMPAVLFLSYLLYGMFRPWISRRWRREIEMEDEKDLADEQGQMTNDK